MKIAVRKVIAAVSALEQRIARQNALIFLQQIADASLAVARRVQHLQADPGQIQLLVIVQEPGLRPYGDGMTEAAARVGLGVRQLDRVRFVNVHGNAVLFADRVHRADVVEMPVGQQHRPRLSVADGGKNTLGLRARVDHQQLVRFRIDRQIAVFVNFPHCQPFDLSLRHLALLRTQKSRVPSYCSIFIEFFGNPAKSLPARRSPD